MEARICKTCGIEKSHEEFPKNKAYKDGIRPSCIACRRKIEMTYYNKYKNDDSKSYKYSYSKDKNSKLKSTYNITLDEYVDLVHAQGEMCGICKTPYSTTKKAFAVDHCHTTGHIRGVLCEKCNTALGLFNEDSAILTAAIEYLQNGGAVDCSHLHDRDKLPQTTTAGTGVSNTPGVSLDKKSGKWVARVYVSRNKYIPLGRYTSIALAKEAIDAYKLEIDNKG